MTISEKRCRLCNGVFPATTEFFYPRENSPDRLRHECKLCKIDQQARKDLGERYEVILAEKRDREALSKQGLKSCATCKSAPPATPEFFKRNKSAVDGLNHECKSCSRARRAQSDHGENLEAFLTEKREWQDLIKQGLKRCPSCNTVYPATPGFFHRHQKERDGLTAPCKTCVRARYHGDNLENFLAQKRAQQVLREQGLKQCAICQQIHPATSEFFHKHPASADRLSYHCKPCVLALAKQYAARRSPEMRERKRINARRWYRKPSSKKYLVAQGARRRAQQRSLPNIWTAHDWQRCLDYWHDRCAVCEHQLRDLFGEIAPHADHWIALNDPRPGNPGTVAVNMICLCNKCNLSKSDADPLEWLVRRYGRKKAIKIMTRIQAYFDWLKHNPA